MRDIPPSTPSQTSTQERTNTSMPRQERTAEQETTTVSLTEERLCVSKTASSREATITKKPVTETKTVEVPVTHEDC
jgi:stress response protein YsnF